MLFISYARQDLTLVQPLVKLLRASGNEVFLDHDNLDYGSDWINQLTDAIGRSERFLLFWSRSAAASEFVTQEWKKAIQVSSLSIVPIFLDETPLPEELKKYHGTDELQQIANKLRWYSRITKWLTYLVPTVLVLAVSFAAYQYTENADKTPRIVLRSGKTISRPAPPLELRPHFVITAGSFAALFISYAGLRRSRRSFVSQFLVSDSDS